MSSTLAHGLNYIASQQIKQIIQGFKNDDDDNLYTSVSYPLIYTKNNYDNKQTSPFVMVSPVTSTNGATLGSQYTYGQFTDLDKNPDIQKKITKYFLYKIRDKWLLNELRSLLVFVKLTDGNPALINNMNDYKPELVDKDSAENIEKRIKYLSEILINFKIVKHVLKKIVSDNQIRWTQLNRQKGTVKKIFKKYFYSKLEDAVLSASK
jgi:hypothetical protein